MLKVVSLKDDLVSPGEPGSTGWLEAGVREIIQQVREQGMRCPGCHKNLIMLI